jgi:hypothetical protein
MCVSFAILFTSLNVSMAQTDSLQIDGPREVQPGKLVCLAANTVEDETPFWIVLRPLDLEYEHADGGKKLFFSSGCSVNRSVTILLLAQQVKGNRIVTRQIRRTIEVKADADPSAPESGEPRPVELPVTDSPLYEAVLKAWPLIGTDAAKELSPEVAKNMDAVALLCESGKAKEVSTIWKELSMRNRDTLGLETMAWNPVAEALQTQFKRLALQSPEEHAFHLRATSAALRSACQKASTESQSNSIQGSQQ